jgi:anaerobic selenocysteine-containing dehydrogenase
MKKVVHAACPHDCPDACGVLITIEDGRATKIQGDPAHPVTRGFLCAKVSKYLDRVYSPDRVLYPMRRVAPKGGGAKNANDFRRISWDEALSAIAERFKAVAKEFGPEVLLPYSYGGTLAVLSGSSMDRRFFHRFGASQLERSICSAAGEAGLKSVLGVKLGTEPEQFAHSRYIIAWGANIHGNNVHLWPFIKQAHRAGARLVVIDPYKTRTAKHADWYIPINPGTDAALALGMMHVIIGAGLHDADYVEKYTVGFEQLREKVKEYAPHRIAKWTGVSEEHIHKLAREYATHSPAVIRVNYGVQRSEGGGMAMRAITMLPCITGAWKEVGGGLQLSTSGGWGLRREALDKPELMQQTLGRPARVVNMVELGKALNTRVSQSQRSDSRAEAAGPVHRGARAVLHRHDRLCRYRSAGDDLFRAEGSTDCIRALLHPDVEPGNRTAGRVPVECRGVSRASSCNGIRRGMLQRVGRRDDRQGAELVESVAERDRPGAAGERRACAAEF